VSLLNEDGARRLRPGRLAVRVGGWTLLGGSARPVRQAVFVDELGIAAALEFDERDAGAVHAVAFDSKGAPVGTGRLLPDARIGRMAVLPPLRGKGVGAAILQALVAIAAGRGEREVRLHAQTNAVKFYLREGFVIEGEEYLEAGIPHWTMFKRLGDVGSGL
jgi:predicted GNAT family N-acyltransferase